MNELLAYTFDVNVFDFVFMMSQKSSMFYADSFVKVCWDYQNANQDHATIKQLNSFDVIPHPRKIHLDDRWPLYIRSEMTKSEMIDQGWDKRRINSLSESKLETPSYRREQLQSLGYSDVASADKDKRDDLYEVIEVWGKMDLSGKDEPEEMAYVVIANGEKIINPGILPGNTKEFQSPYRHGKIPVAHLPYNPLPGMFLSESFIDPVATLQEELDALENEKAANYRRRNNPPIKVNKNAELDLSTFKFVNSMPWLVSSMDDLEFMEVPDLAPSIDNTQQMIKRDMQGRTGANDILLVADGVDIKGSDTATGASIANENTKVRFRPQATLIDLFVQRIGDLCIALYQDERYFDREKAIAIADEEGNYSETLIGPDKVKGDLMFKVDSASSLAESNEMKLQKAINIKSLYAEDTSKNQEELDKPIFESAGYDFNKVQRNKEELTGDAVMQLKKLIAVTKQPGFANAPEAQKQEIFAQIDKLKSIIQGGQPEAPTGQNAEMPEVEA